MADPEETEAPQVPGGDSSAEDPTVLMEELLELLKLLNYEKSFLSKGFKPVSRAQFSWPAQNQSEQFAYFTALVSWLLQESGSQTSFNKYDDPSTIAGNILSEIKKLGLDLSLPPNKLKLGHGDVPCQVLVTLARNALKAKRFTYRRPVFESEGGELEGENIEGEDESEVLMQDPGDSGDEGQLSELKPAVQGGMDPQADDAGDDANAIIWSSIDHSEWKMECERVSGRLKLSADAVGSDAREWRSHLEQTKAHKTAVAKERTETEPKLSRIGDDVSKILDKITAQERKINETMGDIAGDYKSQATMLSNVTMRYKQLSESVGEKQNELAQIADRLEAVSERLDKQGRSVTDNTPLIQIKEALKALKNEGKEIELRAAVLSHSLFQAKLREKAKI